MEDVNTLKVSALDIQAAAELLAHPPALIRAAREYAKLVEDDFGKKLLRHTDMLPAETKLAIED